MTVFPSSWIRGREETLSTLDDDDDCCCTTLSSRAVRGVVVDRRTMGTVFRTVVVDAVVAVLPLLVEDAGTNI